jgi:soluble lytic murein transglycosylase-like protein
MAVENVYQNIESILQRIESIKRRFSGVNPSRFQETLQEEMNTEQAAQVHAAPAQAEPGEVLPLAEQPMTAASGYEGIIEQAAEQYRIPAALIRAVIKQESNFNTEAVSHKGAMGLMQLMPETADLLGVSDPFEPSENIFGGTEYLADMINRYDGNLNKALAAYNAGPDRVQENIPKIRETVNFVESVLHYYESFSKTRDEEGF